MDEIVKRVTVSKNGHWLTVAVDGEAKEQFNELSDDYAHTNAEALRVKLIRELRAREGHEPEVKK